MMIIMTGEETTTTMESETISGKTAMEAQEFESAIHHFGRALQLATQHHNNQEDHPSTAPRGRD